MMIIPVVQSHPLPNTKLKKEKIIIIKAANNTKKELRIENEIQ